MDWTNERYVRAYTRDTADYLVLSWQARGLWWEVLRKADRSGVIATSHGARGIAALVRWPLEVVQEALAELLADGCIRECDGGFVLPNYLDAQEATASTAQRKRESRESRRLQKVTNRDHDGTNRDQKSRAVTSGHAESQDVTPNLAEPNLAEPNQEKKARRSARAPSGPHQEAISRFSELYEASTGQAYAWDGRSAKLIGDLVKAHGAPEVLRRSELLFAGKGPHWLQAPFTAGTLSSQWNALASESKGPARGHAQQQSSAIERAFERVREAEAAEQSERERERRLL